MQLPPMRLTVSTWNINSVRLRIDLVAKFIKAVRPDVLCLQETKCPDDKFPLKRFRRLGYEHAALNGQKGYHGVAVLSRLPFESFNARDYCGKTDCRHIAAVLGERAGLRDPVTLHNFYVPAGGDIPDPQLNPKFAHKLAFLDEMRAQPSLRLGDRRPRHPGRRSQRGAARARRLEPQADAAHRLAHADRMREARLGAAERRLDRRHARCACPSRPSSTPGGATARADWEAADKGRRLDHIWVAPMLADRVSDLQIRKGMRGSTRPSDHVPVTLALEL